MTFIHPTSDVELSGKILVVPIVSTANVGQLAVDLLISTLSLQRIAILDPSLCVPVVGGRDDGLPGITTPLELFGRSNCNVVAIQQRSPVLVSRKQEFVDALLAFIGSSGFSAVLFLSGIDLSDRTDSQMFSPTFQIRLPNGPPLKGSPLDFLEHPLIPIYTSPVAQRPYDNNERMDIPFVPGGGLTRRILSSIPDNWAIPTGSLLQFVIEGDNRADAKLLATVASKVLGVASLVEEWRQPQSWKAGLFGSPHDQNLYG